MNGAGEITKYGWQVEIITWRCHTGGMVRYSSQTWGKNDFRFLGGRSGNLWQHQNYCIILSIWTLVAMLVNYIKEIAHRVSSDVPSLPFCFSPVPIRRWGRVEFKQNCNIEISWDKCMCTKEYYLDFDMLYKVTCLKIVDPFFNWELGSYLSWTLNWQAEGLFLGSESTSLQNN